MFENYDRWRSHPMLRPCPKSVVPGLGSAVVIFSVYLIGEQIYKSMYPAVDHHHGASTHSDEHHTSTTPASSTH
eukprot:CAMPEP_0174235208 /NCGR_PEP_ID=MMETSP0417-20130205/4731_1 /TAXON_ID=242541 /ORGANISM="Mayorella sp, Strain BSH-02190019" /LENGTH=73 /DNA_ID=CAMNT_0015313685 /DNA_START=58 /DNA_END=276 /DNA_ORIENTATION=+